ncbi:hypothetical protein GPECTOR_1g605 [Gonium pectorale]|uniref:RING-type domain-containing protein n=1 Tax=Gonium pectorale TaxID=33097 RepID=A0A150H3R8_GONPE|nr:hypothetical protein GPECTOR_1g605 [Gonium pectorale]|eukprot:KXZ56672.1 hypothetical protein GPECTOR_1g605 [Gonium pectorale]
MAALPTFEAPQWFGYVSLGGLSCLGLSALFFQLVEEEVYFKEHTSGRVTQECFEVRREHEQREAFLEDLSGSLKVDSLQRAEGLSGVLETRQSFRPVDLLQGTLLQAVINKAFKAMVKHGVRSTERYLPVNATVTLDSAADAARDQERRTSAAAAGPSGRDEGLAAAVVAAAAAAGADMLGQAVAAVGTAAVQSLPYTLRMPLHGPFLVTDLTLPQLRASMERTTRTLRAIGWGLGVLGAVLAARKVALQMWRQREQRRAKRLMAEADAARRQRQAQRAAEAGAKTGTAGAGGGAGHEEDEGVRGAGTCVVCMDRDTEVVFSGCGHMCACFPCSAALNRCPICRVASKMVRVYRP